MLETSGMLHILLPAPFIPILEEKKSSRSEFRHTKRAKAREWLKNYNLISGRARVQLKERFHELNY